LLTFQAQRFHQVGRPTSVTAHLYIHASNSKPDFLVNTLPALKYIPEWFPGAGWKRAARFWRQEKEALVEDLYKLALEDIVRVHQAVHNLSWRAFTYLILPCAQNEEKSKHIMVASLKTQALKLGLTEAQSDDYVQQIAITLFGGMYHSNSDLGVIR
jgi:hypothetical protein